MRPSFPSTLQRRGLRVAGLRAVAGGLAAAATIAVAAGAPAAAHAEFTLKVCQGGAIQGEGSSLQKTAQLSFWDSSQVYLSENAAFGCGSAAPPVTFHSASSGCGLDAVGAGGQAAECSFKTEEGGKPANGAIAGYRDSTDRFGASDFAPDPTEEANIDNGPTGAGTPGAGKIHVIPVAGAAITVIVHFPEGCELQEPGTGTAAGGAGSKNDDTSSGGVNDPAGPSGDPNEFVTGDSLVEGTLRVHIPAQALEEIWEHKITTWGEIPTPIGGKTLGEYMTGAPTSPQETGIVSCGDVPIRRIVRLDTSGTSYNFKAYLSVLPSFKEDGATKLWASGEVGSVNTAWPLGGASETGAPRVAANSSNVCVEPVDEICHAATSGGGGLTNAVNATDGSIGYVDLATAREKGFTIEPKKADHSYWIPLEAVNPSTTPATVKTGVFDEPTTDASAHFNPALNTSSRGANCAGADFRGMPSTTGSPNGDPTLGDWSKAIATGGSTYPVCVITYDLAFDDDAPVYGNTPGEEAKGRTVKDYLTAVTSQAGQFELAKFDYATLPQAIIQDAQNGVAAIGWNKSAGASGKEEQKTGPPAENKTATTVTPGSTPTAALSNSFTIASAKVKGKNIVLSLVLPGAGKVQIQAVSGAVTVSSVTASVSGGQGTVTLPISSAAQKKIAKSKSKKLSVKITVTFTPSGGTAATQTKTLTVTQAAITAKSKKKATKKKGKKKA